ncbi:hypothetical protein [Desertivirga arenae]|uniref:hypothetical protein n=1 Tax=Desertivirga arenae TaxID=2810309 RepID=UPI001A95D8B5|nr:hypothetical protein [Pedobacter sp. SYSU D00823]
MRSRRILIASILALGFYGCKKDFPEQTPEQKALQEDTFAATNILTVEGVLNEIEFIAKQVPAINQNGSFLSCATITKQDVEGGQKIDVNFNINTTCSDNTSRSGKLSLMYYSNGTISVTPSNYVVSNTAISGTYNFGTESINQVNYLLLNVLDGKFTSTNGAFINFSVEKRSTIKLGAATPDFSDDVIEIDQASYQLEVANVPANTKIAAETKTPYTLKYSCSDKFRPRSGAILFQRLGQNKRMIEFGSGNCSDVPKLSEIVQ